MDCSPPGSSVHGILQARIMEFPPPGDGPNPGIEPVSLMSPALVGGFVTTSTTREAPIANFSMLITSERKHAPLSLTTVIKDSVLLYLMIGLRD